MREVSFWSRRAFSCDNPTECTIDNIRRGGNKHNWQPPKLHQLRQARTICNAGIVAATITLPENSHLHHAKAEVQDVVDGLIADNMEDVV